MPPTNADVAAIVASQQHRVPLKGILRTGPYRLKRAVLELPG